MKNSVFALILGLTIAAVMANEKPNVVVILADDLGSGDVSCYYKGSKIKTPHLDALAAEGMRFTDGHSNSAVCTPTRYGVLTGRYCWRSRLKRGVLNGYGSALIEEGRETVASLLKKNGYTTACIGKWHLGMNFAKTGKQWDYTKPIQRGPNSVGFDYFMGISASLDFPPYVLIENDKFTQNPTDTCLGNRVELHYLRKGVQAPGFKHVDYLPLMTKQSCDWIKSQAAGKTPFFLYMPLPSPHKPVFPAEQFKGKSGIGDYGDYVVETDWSVGQVVKTLKDAGVYENTLIVFTSDNASFATQEKYDVIQKGHKVNADYRGQKADVYEGGHRVPFIWVWKGKVKGGTVSDQVISTVDIMATVAGAAGAKLGNEMAEDSYDLTPVLTGKQGNEALREATIYHSAAGMFAIRKGKWKLIDGKGSGGRTKVPKDDPKTQLYDMEADVSETTNVYEKHPEVVKELKALLEKYKSASRSIPERK